MKWRRRAFDINKRSSGSKNGLSGFQERESRDLDLWITRRFHLLFLKFRHLLDSAVPWFWEGQVGDADTVLSFVAFLGLT